jgi:hypothetical protein
MAKTKGKKKDWAGQRSLTRPTNLFLHLQLHSMVWNSIYKGCLLTPEMRVEEVFRQAQYALTLQ